MIKWWLPQLKFCEFGDGDALSHETAIRGRTSQNIG
jgi:hypothetical protein